MEEKMKFNKISAVVPQEKEKKIIRNIEDSRASLDFLVELDSNQRVRMAKLSQSRVGFVDKSLLHMQNNPEYIPPYIELKEFAKDVALKDCLRRMLAKLNAFSERLNDTLLQVESEAYRTARLYYKSVKAAASEGMDDAVRIAHILSYYHKGQGPSQSSKENGEGRGVG
jgi:hypothetical protein